MKRTNHVLWGIVLVLLGAVFAARSLGVEVNIFFDGWWTLFILVPCIIGLITERDKTWHLIGLLVGVMLLLDSREIVSFDTLWKFVIPALVILLGLKLIFGGLFRKKDSAEELVKQKKTAAPGACAAFSGQHMNCDGKPFGGTDLAAVFGGIECDLRNAVFEQDCVINVCAVFGGIDILLPKTVNVKLGTTAIFGGAEDKRGCSEEHGTVTVCVRGLILFGGVDIKNEL